MAKKRRIPTPLSQHWNHFRTGLLPLLAFLACLWATMLLWERRATQGTIVAEAEATAVDVTSGVGGLLIELPNKPEGWQLWEEVAKGEILASLDETLLSRQIDVIRAETDQLIADLRATQIRTKVDLIGIDRNVKRDTNERYDRVESLYLQSLSLNRDILVDQKEQARLEENLKIQQGAAASNAVANAIIVNLNNELEVVRQRIYQNEALLGKTNGRLVQARKNWDEYKNGVFVPPDISILEEDLKKTVDAQNAKIDLIREQMNNMTIRAPVSGKIAIVHKRPTESVEPGDPVITIVSTEAEYVVGYWRERHSVRPKRGLPVSVRLTQPGGQEYDCVIEEVGPQYGQVPGHQSPDPNRAEYGVPVKIELPDDLKTVVKPGELVHVIYRGKPVGTAKR